jgi:LysR family transcriptional regulator, transcriptional activator of nhaA
MCEVEWLNYHHLFYFSVIAREGGLAPAARKLRLTHSTLSAQLKTLERHFGAALFERRGRRLVLTPFGVDAASYAEDIFRLGRELSDVAGGRVSPGREVLRVGVVAGLPKTLVHHLLSPALDMMGAGTVQILQQNSNSSLDALVAGRLHLVISDDVPPAAPSLKIHAHALGETDVLFYASAGIAASLTGKFPESLEKAWFVLPPSSVALRRSLDDWFLAHGLAVNIKAEIEDAGLLRAFGSAGRGIFPVRAALSAEVEDLHDVKKVGGCKGVRERYFLLSTERRIKHPGVSALIEGARRGLHAVAPSKKKARTQL